jgi:alpha/beta superfamily hydrolase
MRLKSHLILVSSLLFFGAISIAFSVALKRYWLLAAGLVLGACFGWAVEALFRRWGFSPKKALRLFILVLLSLALVVVFGVVPTYAAYWGVRPVHGPPKVTPQTMGLAFEDVILQTADGLRLTAWYLPSQNGAAIIALHGFNGNRSSCLVHAFSLVKAGYGMLLVDMRAHGESQGALFNDWDTYQDALAGVRYLQSRPDVDPGKIGGIGLSSGASALLYAAAETPDLRVLILDGAPLGQTGDALDPLLPYARQFFFMTPLNWMYFQMSAVFSESKVGSLLPVRTLWRPTWHGVMPAW